MFIDRAREKNNTLIVTPSRGKAKVWWIAVGSKEVLFPVTRRSVRHTNRSHVSSSLQYAYTRNHLTSRTKCPSTLLFSTSYSLYHVPVTLPMKNNFHVPPGHLTYFPLSWTSDSSLLDSLKIEFQASSLKDPYHSSVSGELEIIFDSCHDWRAHCSQIISSQCECLRQGASQKELFRLEQVSEEKEESQACCSPLRQMRRRW